MNGWHISPLIHPLLTPIFRSLFHWLKNVINSWLMLIRMTAIVHDERFSLHDNPSHPERAERLLSVMEYIKELPFYGDLEHITPEPISEESLLRVHSDEMVARIKSTVGWLDPDTYLSEDSYEVARLAAGGLTKACDVVASGDVDNAFALIRPPGHHATATRSMGFCLFNNAALAADYLTRQGKRVLIFDHDVHHGNGVADIFYDRSDVLYESVHLSPHFPGTGAVDEIGVGPGRGYTVNAPLPHRVGDEGVREIMREIMLPVAEQFDPDFVIVCAGFDSHHTDALGGLFFTIDFYGELLRQLMDVQSDLVCTLEGGYKLDVLKKGVAIELGMLHGTPLTCDDEAEDGRDPGSVIDDLRRMLEPYWDVSS